MTNTTIWGVYNIQGKLPDGQHVAANDRRATRWFIRWRVNEREHKRTLAQKGHAETFRKRLVRAQLMNYPADQNGYPIEPNLETTPSPGQQNIPAPTGHPNARSFREYCEDVWWPTIESDLGERNRAGHRKNMNDAIMWLQYRPGDPRIGTRPRTRVGDSILLDDLTSDDLKHAITSRRNHNDRTAAANRRKLEAAITAQVEVDIHVEPETATDRTVRAFWVTLGMIVKSAAASRQTDLGSLAGASSLVPRPRTPAFSKRMVPSTQEVFDLSDAIAQLGPRMKDGRPTGERFRALILVAGTLGGRPGELVAHRPQWLKVEDGITLVRFHRSEGRFYDRASGVRGATINSLKHRDPDDERLVPALESVAEALATHLARGYNLPDRTFTSSTGRAHLDWANLADTYWRPACERVFGASAKPELARMPPKTLRKAAITFWLDSGVSTTQAAEWAGHSEEVAQRYYAGRVSPGFTRELALLARHAQESRVP